MNRFDKKSLESLEYPSIKGKIAGYCLCSGGRRLVERLKPAVDIITIEENLAETFEMVELLEFEESIPLEHIERIESLLEKIEVSGAILDPQQLKCLADFQRVIVALSQFGKNKEEKYQRIVGYLKQLEPLNELILRVDEAIDPAFEIRDSASDRLRRIRNDKALAKAKIISMLQRILNRKRHQSDRLDDVVTIREGRYVIPVAGSEFNHSAGVVHDRSKSGATFFVEPPAAVELNNKLRELELDEKREIERILRALTKFTSARKEQLRHNWHTYSRLDFLHAKALFAQSINAGKPILKDEPVVNLKAGYHPLLLLASENRADVVPASLELGYERNVLIITGPNTGGKTVTLKTVGLLVLMTQSGLLIPADSQSEFGVFKKVFADIGDEQSIELSLSTFSSHISRITTAIVQCDRNTLLLFDEIGAGTDPKEGAALGESIIEYMAASGAKSIVTTHYSALKTIAEANRKVQNASLEFDRKTLKPTYKLRTGLPGSSYAIEIAQRLGMPDKIIKQANSLVGTQERSLTNLLTNLEDQLITIEKEKAKLAKQIRHAEELESFWQDKADKVKRREEELRKEGLIEAQQLVDETRKKLDQVIKRVQEEQASKNSFRKGRKTIEELRRELNDKLVSLNRPLKSGKEPQVGDRVWIDRFQTEGDLVEKYASGKKSKVQIGSILYTIDVADLHRLDAEKEKRTLLSGVNYQPFADDFANEVSLRGMTIEEARETLDKYFDQVALANLEKVHIVHGKGTGALRRMVREYLSRNKMVESFELAQWNTGGAGVTVVKLKK